MPRERAGVHFFIMKPLAFEAPSLTADPRLQPTQGSSEPKGEKTVGQALKVCTESKSSLGYLPAMTRAPRDPDSLPRTLVVESSVPCCPYAATCPPHKHFSR
jgi:hypothetical protein